MPTLDDAPKTPRLSALVAGDLVQVYDVSAQPAGSKTITVAELLEQAVGLLPTSSSGLAVGDLWLNSGVLTRKMS
jgi:hypothetical protein